MTKFLHASLTKDMPWLISLHFLFENHI
uniref:Uncharacterized protein n=1 Tax=Arundo donax TaxID=35708 RepID=A0A0A8YS30_ARUDO